MMIRCKKSNSAFSHRSCHKVVKSNLLQEASTSDQVPNCDTPSLSQTDKFSVKKNKHRRKHSGVR